VSRSIFPITTALDRGYFGLESGSHDQVGQLEGGRARFGKTYADEPDRLIAALAEDEAVDAAVPVGRTESPRPTSPASASVNWTFRTGQILTLWSS
jgi:hypothetical protein